MRPYLWILLVCLSLPTSALPPLPSTPAPLDRATDVAARPLLSWSGGPNLLANGGFEAEFADWTLVAPNPGAGRILVVTNFRSNQLNQRPVYPLEGERMALLRIYEPGFGSLRYSFTVPDTGKPVRLVFAEWLSAGYFGFSSTPSFEGTYGIRLMEFPPRVTQPETLRELRPLIRNQAIQQGWTRRIVDITEFAGRTVQFVVSANVASSWLEVLIDDVRLETGSDTGTQFEVYLGEQPTLGPGDLLVTTRDTVAQAPSLRPGTTHYWRVVAQDATGTSPGPLWRFVAAARGPMSELIWHGPNSPVIANRSSVAGLTATDASGHLARDYSGPARLAALVPSTQVPKVLLSEITYSTSSGSIGSSTGAAVEIANVWTNTVNVAGWTLSVWDQARWPEPVATLVFPANASLSAGRVATVRSTSSQGPGNFPLLNLGKRLYWSIQKTNQLAAALLQDSTGAIIDFVAIGGADPRELVHPRIIPDGQWIGASLPGLTNGSPFLWASWQRIGNRDSHSPADWGASAPTASNPHRLLTRPFEPSPVGRNVSPTDVVLDHGIWRGTVTVPGAPDGLELFAFTLDGALGRQVLKVETNSAILVELPTRAREDAGSLHEAGRVKLADVTETDLTVQLVSSRPDKMGIPATVMIPAGASETAFDVTLNDNAERDGSVAVQVTVSASGYTGVPATIWVDDNETAVLGLELPASAREGGPTSACFVTVNPPPDRDTIVYIRADIPSADPFFTEVVVPAGVARAPFRLELPDDTRLDNARTITVFATVENWTAAQGTMAMLDDEQATLTVKLPFGGAEMDLVMTNAGQVKLGGTLPTNVVVRLTSSNPQRLQVPAEVLVLAGTFRATFDVTLVDNELLDGDETITVTAIADGFSEGSGLIGLADNEAAAFLIETITSPQLAAREFTIGVQAQGTNGQPVLSFRGPLNVSLRGSVGSVPITVKWIAFNGNGRAELQLVADVLGSAFQIVVDDGLGHAAESNPFDIVEPPYREFGEAVADVAWDAKSQRLYLSLPLAGDGSQAKDPRIVAFDPVSRQATASVTTVPGVGPLFISGGGEFLYAVALGTARIFQYTLPGLELVRSWTVINEEGVEVPVEDLAVQPGHPEVVAVTRYQPNRVAHGDGVVVYDQGQKRERVLDHYTRLVNRIEFSPDGGVLYGYENETTATAFTRMRVDGEGITLLEALDYTTSMVPGMDFALQGDIIVFGDGEVYVPETGGHRRLQFGGSNLAIATDAARQRVYGAEGYGLDTRVRAFDFLGQGLELGHVLLPKLYTQFGGVSRLVRWGNDGFAVLVSSRLAYFHSELVPALDAVDLSLNLALPPEPPVAGEPTSVVFTVRNFAGHIAPATKLTLPWRELPVRDLSVEVNGQLVVLNPNDAGWVASLGTVAPDGVLEATVRFTPTIGGSLTLTGSVLANAPEPIRDNNSVALETFVDINLTRGTSAQVKLVVDSLVANPVRPRLYAAQGQGFRLFEIDPFTGHVLHDLALGDSALRFDVMAVSDDGSRLYVGSSSGNSVTVIDTETFTVVRYFELGSEPVTGLLFADDLVVQPGQPELVAVALRRPVGFTRHAGIQFFDLAGPRGPRLWSLDGHRLAFSGDGQTLYGVNVETRETRRRRARSDGTTLEGILDRGFTTAPMGITVTGGRVYVGDRVYADDPTLKLLGRLPSAEFGLAPGAALDGKARLGFRPNGVSDSPGLELIDLERLAPIGSVPAPVSQRDRQPIRWGTDGLAWIDGQTLGLLRTDWLPATDANADLAVSLETAGKPSTPDGPIAISVRVRNLGPAPATEIKVNCNLPAAVVLRGPGDEPIAGNADLPLGELAPGAEIELRLRIETSNAPNVLAFGVRVRAAEGDPVGTNQQATAIINRAPIGSNPERLDLAGLNHALWDPARKLFYLSLGPSLGRAGNSVVIYDPGRGVFGRPSEVGTVPNRLALADDGSRLYIALDGSSEVAVYALPWFTRSQQFSLGVLTPAEWRTVRDSFVVPGEPTHYVASLYRYEVNPNPAGVALYRDGIKAPREFPLASPVSYVEPGSDAGSFWAADQESFQLYRPPLVSDGIGAAEVLGNFGSMPGDFVRVKEVLVGANGTVLQTSDATVKGVLGPFPNVGGTPIRTLICAEPDGSRIFALPSNSAFFVQAYDLASLSFLQQGDTWNGAEMVVGSFQRWGVDGLAFVTVNGLWLFHSPVIAVDPNSDWDGDGLPDAWEVAHFTNPHFDDAAVDLDGDGLSNADEFTAGTAPAESSSRFEFRLKPTAEGGWSGEVATHEGRMYQLESAAEAPGPWRPEGQPFMGAEAVVTLPLPAEGPTRLFRMTVTIPGKSRP